MRGLWSAARFLWAASAGYRLTPWRSPYLRWRLETFTGKPAGTLRAKDFFQFAVSERRQMGRFFGWLADIEKLASEERE